MLKTLWNSPPNLQITLLNSILSTDIEWDYIGSPDLCSYEGVKTTQPMAMGIGQHMTPTPHPHPPTTHTHTHTQIAVFLFKSMLRDDRLLEILWIPALILSSSYCEHHVQRQKAYIGFLIWSSNSYSKPSRSTPPKSENSKLIWVFCLRKASYHQQLLLRTIMMHSIDLRTVLFWNLCSNLCFTSAKPICTSKLLLPQ